MLAMKPSDKGFAPSSTRGALRTSRRNRAFSLLDMLGVAAAVMIVTAIAVPNYITAQTRAKVSRTKADMRNMAAAVEAYITDNGVLGRTCRLSAQWTRARINSMLTTPVAYMPQSFPDVFNTVDNSPYGINDNRQLLLYGRNPNRDAYGEPMGYLDSIATSTAPTFFQYFPSFFDPIRHTYSDKDAWLIYSIGPDVKYTVLEPVFPSPFVEYDPTNGTLSFGDIIRWK